MKKQLLIVLIGLMVFTAQGQSFSWGYPFKKPNETEKNISHVVDGGLYRVATHYDSGVFNHQIRVDQFSANDLERSNTLDLSVKQPPMGLASLTFHSLFQKEGTQFVFFYTDFDRKDKKYKLLARDVDIKSGEMGELRPVASMDSKNGNYIMAASNNGSRFAVLKELPFDKKSNEKVEIILLDENQNVIAEKVVDFPFQDKRDKQHTVFVSDEGQVVVAKKIDEKKEKPYVNLYVWQTGQETVTMVSLRQPDDYQIPQFIGRFEGGDFYFLAMLSHEKSGTFGLKIDMNGRHSGVHGNGLLAVKIGAGGETEYVHRNDFDIISSLNLKDFILASGQMYVVADRMYVEKKSKGSNIGQGESNYDYTYLNNGYFILGLDPATGQTQWSQKIDTFEPNTHNDNADFLSILYYQDGENLVLLYNETRDLNTGIVHIVFNRRFPIKEVISPTGETISREPLLAAGIGVTKEERFELNTQYLIPVTPNRYILRASNGVEYKYGFMER